MTWKCNKQLNNKNFYETYNEFPGALLNKALWSSLSSIICNKYVDEKGMN